MTSLSTIHYNMHALCRLPNPFIIKDLKKWRENNSKMKGLNKLEMVAMFFIFHLNFKWLSPMLFSTDIVIFQQNFKDFLGFFFSSVNSSNFASFFGGKFLIKNLHKIFLKKNSLLSFVLL